MEYQHSALALNIVVEGRLNSLAVIAQMGVEAGAHEVEQQGLTWAILFGFSLLLDAARGESEYKYAD